MVRAQHVADPAVANGDGVERQEAPTWVPRAHGLGIEFQRSLRAGVVEQFGVPSEWLRPNGGGLPEWWLKTAFPWMWRWRLH